MLEKIKDYFSIPDDQPELNRATLAALARRVPLLYLIVSINMLTLTWTHRDLAPTLPLFLGPAIYIAFSLQRTFMFLRRGKKASFSDQEVRNLLKMGILLVVPASFLVIVWEIFVLQYATAQTQGHVIFFAAISAVAPAFCLIHMRQSATLLLLVTVPPTVIALMILGDQMHYAVAVNMIAISLATFYIINGLNRDFVEMIKQQIVQREQRQRLQQLNLENLQLANTDALTSLPNRRYFYQSLDQQILNATRTDEQFAVALLDLDGFKPVNDVFGHPAGDALLRAVSERLQSRLDENAQLARLGGDEFGIILNNPGDNDDVIKLCQDLCDVLRTPFKLKEGIANIAGTIGIARFPEHGKTRGQIFDRADYALCYSKQRSKGEPIFFSEEHEQAIRSDSTYEQRLREADLEAELYVLFQPIMDMSDDRVVAFEALARWRNPELGDVPPDVFIRTAEQAGLIGKLSSVLLAKALRAAIHWPSDVHLSFNLSAVDLSSKASIERITQKIDTSGFAPERIIFEVTESAVMLDFNRVINALEALRDTGARIALDDFGTGFSSLSYVQRLPLDRLKIDRSFVHELETNIASRKIVETIAVMCRNLELGCVVEGVETLKQLDIVQRMGLQEIQGFFFAKPMIVEDALAFAELHNQNAENIAWLSA